MNRIAFDIRMVPTPDVPDARTYEVLDIIVDGHDLLELVRAVEGPFATAEGHPELAGSYEAIPARLVLPQLGGNSADKVSIYDCECGCLGCWPLSVHIAVADEIVTWSDFEQPHRGPNSHVWWRYDQLGPFRFWRAQYEEATAKADAELRHRGRAQ